MNTRPPYLTWLLTLVLLGANLWYFFGRSWEDSFFPASYSTIYYPTDMPVIKGWHQDGGELAADMGWDATPTGWHIYQGDQLVRELEGPQLRFSYPGDSERHPYTVIAQPEGLAPPMDFTVRFFTKEWHQERGHDRDPSYEVLTDVPLADFPQYTVEDWIDRFDYVSTEGLAETDRLLREVAGIQADDGVRTKLAKLMRFLRDDLGRACRGTPDDDIRWRDPWEIYQMMKSGESLGFCMQQSQLFIYFANRAGLSTRMVQGARIYDRSTYIYSGHTWVEIWFPDQQRWGWNDPSFALIHAQDKNGRILNTVELARLRQHDAWDGVTATIYKDWGWPDVAGEEGAIIDAPIEQVGGVIERQFRTSSLYKWRFPPFVEDLRSDYTMLFKDWTFFWGNLERYYFKAPLAYADYPGEGARTYLIRHLLLWPFLAGLTLSVWSWFSYRRKRN